MQVDNGKYYRHLGWLSGFIAFVGLINLYNIWEVPQPQVQLFWQPLIFR